MFFKMQIQIAFFLASIAAIKAALLPETSLENFDNHPSYNFKYSVDDAITGDVKTQTESRDGDNVQGQYTLNDSDGYKRIVDYSSDAESGFKVVVRRERLPSEAEKTTAQKETVSKPSVFIPIKPKLVAPKSPTTTVVHHHQPAVYHQAPQTVHFLHAPPSSAIVKSAPAIIATTHHHPAAIVHQSPAVVHHAPGTVLHHAPALLKTSISTPHHISYVHYH